MFPLDTMRKKPGPKVGDWYDDLALWAWRLVDPDDVPDKRERWRLAYEVAGVLAACLYPDRERGCEVIPPGPGALPVCVCRTLRQRRMR